MTRYDMDCGARRDWVSQLRDGANAWEPARVYTAQCPPSAQVAAAKDPVAGALSAGGGALHLLLRVNIDWRLIYIDYYRRSDAC